SGSTDRPSRRMGKNSVPFPFIGILRAFQTLSETKHGVKGAEFENVLVVVGRGWNQYNFNEMLELASDPSHIPADKAEAFDRNRNLFYVACSRPKRRLAILFTQQLSQKGLQTLTLWFGASAIAALEFA
ncbi:MAG: ATP-dependent helicase, partial [Phycisphaerae bacterium]|nr:ATP-dependent helicase [Phycisphaerae bacterium]